MEIQKYVQFGLTKFLCFNIQIFFQSCCIKIYRIINFCPNADVMCNFCIKNNELPAPIESIPHLFYFCNTIFPILQRFFEKYFTIPVTTDGYFTGQLTTIEKDNKICTLIFDIIRYCIWQFRLSKKNINYYSLEMEVIDMLSTIMLSNKKTGIPYIKLYPY